VDTCLWDEREREDGRGVVEDRKRRHTGNEREICGRGGWGARRTPLCREGRASHRGKGDGAECKLRPKRRSKPR
jgi:hypothetical protein